MTSTAAARVTNGRFQDVPADSAAVGASGREGKSPMRTAALESLHSQVLQSEAQGDAIGGRKWNRLQTIAFIVLASGALWGAIGLAVYRVLTR